MPLYKKEMSKKSHMTEKSHNPRGIMWDSETQIPHLAQNGGKSHPQCGNFDFPKIPHLQIPHVGSTLSVKGKWS